MAHASHSSLPGPLGTIETQPFLLFLLSTNLIASWVIFLWAWETELERKAAGRGIEQSNEAHQAFIDVLQCIHDFQT